MKATILIVLLLLLSSCGLSNTNLSTKNQIEREDSTINQLTETKTNNNEGSIDLNEKKLELKKVNYSNQNVNISFPAIINLNDLEQEKMLNEILKSEAMQVLDYFGENGQDIELDVNYSSKWIGSTSLSIQFTGSSYVKGGPYPNSIFFTTNLDIKNGKKILLRDIVKIDDKFIDLLRQAKYVQHNSDLNVETEAREKLSEYSYAELISYLNKTDELNVTNKLGVFTYFTKESLGISFNVPHVLGDHVEYEISYSDLKKNILTENIAWIDIQSSREN